MPYYGLGSKALIMKNVHDVMELISGLSGKVDYQRDYAAASIGPEKYPGAFINDVVEVKEQILADVFRNTLTIGIVGWLRVAANDNLWAKQDALSLSILTALMVDGTRGNQAYDTTPTRCNTDMGTRFPVGVFTIALDIVYYGRT